MAVRDAWASRIGFVLAATGSAVGLGNLWRFPYVTAENGGAAFLAVYLLAVLVIGVPAMLAEFVVGRGGHRNVVDVYEQLGHPRWRVIGVLGLVTGFWILSYYGVIGGWVLRYVLGSVTGGYIGDPQAYFDAVSVGLDAVAFQLLLMALTVAIVAFGVEAGIEVATKVMVPSILVLMVGLAVWAATLPGSAAGYEFYLTPDLDVLVADFWGILPQALGQALFSLSLGMGVMVTYASYVTSGEGLWGDTVSIVALNTVVGALAGFVVFPLLFAQGVDPGSAGPGAIFVSMATAFTELPAGGLIGLVFFAVVAIAALSSSISLLEVVVAYAVENTDYGRPTVTAAVGGTIFALGVPSALDTAILSLLDGLASNVLLPLGVFLLVLFVGWAYADSAVRELAAAGERSSGLDRGWLWHVRTVLLLAVAGTLGLRLAQVVGVV